MNWINDDLFDTWSLGRVQVSMITYDRIACELQEIWIILLGVSKEGDWLDVSYYVTFD